LVEIPVRRATADAAASIAAVVQSLLEQPVLRKTMKPCPVLLLLMMACVVSQVSLADAHERSGKRSPVPQIARLLGVRVGYNGQGALERTLGKGLRAIGGHPNSRQLWRTRSPNGVIETDGFSMNDEGYYVESLDWTSCDSEHSDPAIPWARSLPRRSGWLGVVNLGMTKREVMRLTVGRLPPPAQRGDTWKWKAKGFVVPKFEQLQDAYQGWTATLEFNHGRLVSIGIECE
jgi:hypothetical protein